MAITCRQCGAGYDVTLFQFGHAVQCTCGQWVDLDRGHVVEQKEGRIGNSDPDREDAIDRNVVH